jgi:nucleotide-binding universal stress UspA family protein
MFKNVMVPLDGSAFAEQALPLAMLLTRHTDAVLRLVMVHDTRPLGERVPSVQGEQADLQLRAWRKEYLGRVADDVAARTGRRPEITLLAGPAVAPALVRNAARRGANLIVMSTHGRGGLNRLWLGSVADSLVRRARVPTLLVRPGGDAPVAAPPRIRRVLAAVDGSDLAESAVVQAAALCRTVDAACSIVRVVEQPMMPVSSYMPHTGRLNQEELEAQQRRAEAYLRELVARSPWLPASVRTEVVVGMNPAETILRTAEAETADVIAVGTRGLGGAARLVVGSVADKVIRGAKVPVLVCPARE